MPTYTRRSTASTLLLLLAAIYGFGQTASPTPSSSPIATPTPENEVAKAAPVNYFFPDLAPGATTYRNKFFSMSAHFALLLDYQYVRQDTISRFQVGPQASTHDIRAARIVLAGQLNFKRPWVYQMGFDYDEHRNRGDKIFDILDFHLTVPLWKKARVVIGKQKEPFIYEMVGDAANLAQQERELNAFFVSRNIGIKYMDNYAKDRISFSLGVFNDWFNSGIKLKESGYQVTGRLTGLPFESRDRRRYVHVGAGLRYRGADKNEMRFRARPEANTLDYYVDTGNFPAKYAKELSLEALFNRNAFSVLAEYAYSWVKSPQNGNPEFHAYYITASYVLTGENRPYDKTVAYARRIIPKSRWGAVEVVGRFGHADVDDTIIKGGKLAMWYGGVNWWASRQWKFGIGYGFNELDRFNTTGRTQRLITRLQWIY